MEEVLEVAKCITNFKTAIDQAEFKSSFHIRP